MNDNFASWFAKAVITIKVAPVPSENRRFRLRETYGIAKECVGVEAALEQYRWRGKDWKETKRNLDNYRDALIRAINERDDASAKGVCTEIIEWGGGPRALDKGGMRLIRQKADERQLVSYLSACAKALRIADKSNYLSCVERMDSMLTKIHAIAATDGLPMYDSRVACTMSMLINLSLRYLGSHDRADSYIALDRSRRPSSDYPVLNRSSPKSVEQWSMAMITLGRLLERTLRENPHLFGKYQTLAERMHAFEAALFMMGYDPTQLRYAFTER